MGEIRTEYSGLFLGVDRRVFVSIPIRLSYKSCKTLTNVIFLIDNGAPTSTLRSDTLERLFANCPQIENTFQSFYMVNILNLRIKAIRSS